MEYDIEVGKKIVIKGSKLLKRYKNYKQVDIVNKLRYLQFEISESTLSNILNDRNAGTDSIFKVAEGIRKLIELELGFIWIDCQFLPNRDKKPDELKEIPGISIKDPSLIKKPGFSFHELGRFPLNRKIEFISEAQQELVEFGLTLRTFSSHFFSRSDAEFMVPVKNLLKKGVVIKCYLLDPESNEARIYFADRGKVLKEELKGPEIIKRSIEKLGTVQQLLKADGYPGKFKIYTYKHIPSNYFMSVDGGTITGKMVVSPYLYAELRAKCPKIEFNKMQNPILYRRYFESLRYLIRDAREIEL